MNKAEKKAARNIVTAGEKNYIRWRAMEEEVADVLSRLKSRGRIAEYIRYERRPDGANEPADFTILRVYRGKAARRRFGISTTLTAKQVRESLFPRIPVLCFPHGTKPQTIERRVLELFKR
jgi:hypothetical protein